MLNFFRSVRKKLLPKSKLSRYIFYAIGEIFLIVIGIGIAVYANNYFEKKKNLQQSNFFLAGMLEDLAADTLLLDKMLAKLDNQLKIEQWVLNKNEFYRRDIDSIKMAASSLKWTFDINNRSFQNIQNTNGSKLFGYDSLYGKISKYYLFTGNRIIQNNKLESSKSISTSPFEEMVYSNLLISNREYEDYSGFKIKFENENNSETDENINEVIENINKIPIQNALNDKFARHNYLFLSLTFCNFEAKKLVREINTEMNLKFSE